MVMYIKKDGLEFEEGKRHAWTIPNRFVWEHGEPILKNLPVETNTGAFCEELLFLENRQKYDLKSSDALAALRALGDCGEGVKLFAGPERQADGKAWGKLHWLNSLHPSGLTQEGTEKLRAWVNKYGVPAPFPTAGSWLNCVAVAAIVSTAIKLHELTKFKKTYPEIAQMAVCAPSNVNETVVTFGMMPPSYEDIATFNIPFPTEITVFVATNDIEKISPKGWANIANVWLAQVSQYFLTVNIAVKLTQSYKLRTVLQISNLLTWLWLHFLNRISETDETTNLKECTKCGTAFEGKSRLCPSCLKQHKNELKNNWRRRKKEGLTDGRVTGKAGER